VKNWPFFKSIHGRGETVETLAVKIHSSRSHVNQVLANKPGRGGQTRKKLIPLLTDEEIAALGWEKFHTAQSSNPASNVTPEQKGEPCST
jgi:hypothetical protein